MERDQARRAKSRPSKSNASDIDSLVEDWFSMEFDAENELKEQRKRMKEAGRLGKDTKEIDWKLVKAGKTLYISSVFDLREWWLSMGSNNGSKWRKIYPVVPAVFSIPAANGHQERTFSACTNFDDVLRQRLKEERFEMSVLLAVNKSFSGEIADEENVIDLTADED